jgi:hypothetical protein
MSEVFLGDIPGEISGWWSDKRAWNSKERSWHEIDISVIGINGI